MVVFVQFGSNHIQVDLFSRSYQGFVKVFIKVFSRFSSRFCQGFVKVLSRFCQGFIKVDFFSGVGLSGVHVTEVSRRVLNR